ncbi:MAG TPA: glycosyl hydrolase [Burkholderiales bacterium]|nr:glycosyl hydrolase [Burkholderiales bacterium]
MVFPKTNSTPASGPVTLLIGTRKGGFLLASDSARGQWKVSAPLHLGNIVHHMMLDPRDGKTLLMAARTGHLGPTILRSTDGGGTWQEAEKPPAFHKPAEGSKALVVDHAFWLTPGHASEPGVWYVGTSPQGLFRSEDGGKTWEGVAGFNENPRRYEWVGGDQEGPPGGATLHSINVDPRDPKHLYIGMSSGGVFESTDRGDTWQPLNKGCSADFLPDPDASYGHDPHCMRLHPLAPDRLYQQNHCGIYRMSRPEGVWVRIGKNMPADVGDIGFPIELHPRDPNTVWVFPMDGTTVWPRVSPGGKPAAYISRDAGETWSRQSNGLPAQDGWFTVKRQAMCNDTHAPVGLYFGTTSGEVWGSNDEGESWRCLVRYLPEIYSLEAAEFK